MDAKKLIAHRGDNTHRPENTLIAVEAALKAGAIAFEFDVQMNADKQLVAFHDEDVKRMTGDNTAKIWEVDDTEMMQLSVHEPEQFGEQHRPTRITHFDAMIDLLRRYPEAQAYVEIKEESLKYWGNDFVMDKLLKSLKGFESQATVISFSAEALAYAKANSNFRIGFVFEEHSQKFKETALSLKPEYMITWYKVLPDGPLWQGDWQWMVYTVNDAELAKELLARGDIDLVETDDIQMMLNT